MSGKVKVASWGAISLLATSLLLSPGSQAVAGQAQTASPSLTMALPADWYPESVAVGPDGSFYVGSWHQGAVARISPQGGEPQVLVPPGSNGLANTQGVLVDATRNALWVCSGNWGFTTVPSTPSALKSYQLDTGAPIASYTMPDKGYCNDLVQDSKGNVYVTDSLHPRILKLALGAQALAIWKEDAAFGGKDGLFLNGIALDGEQIYVSLVAAVPYLLRSKVMPDGSGGAVEQLAMPRVLKNADAIRVYAPKHLAIFESNAFDKDARYGGQVSIADVQKQPAQLTTIVAGLNDPSSGVVVGKRVYFIESKYGLLFQHKDTPEQIPQQVPFDLQSRELPQ